MPSPSDLERLYDDHAPSLFAFLLNLTRSEADTRDVLQELFWRLAARPDLPAGLRDERAFLLRMAHNLWVDDVRRVASRERTRAELAQQPESLFMPDEDPDRQTLRRALSAALEQLPPEQRAVVHLKLWEDLTFDTISQTLDIPLNTAASRYRYAIDKLRARLRLLYDEIQ